MQVSTVLFDLFPQLLDRIKIRRITGQLEHGQPISTLLKKHPHRGTGVVTRTVLYQDHMLTGLTEYLAKKRKRQTNPTLTRFTRLDYAVMSMVSGERL